MFVTVQWTGEIIERIERTGYERIAKPFNPDDLRAAARRALATSGEPGVTRVRLLDLGSVRGVLRAGGLPRSAGGGPRQRARARLAGGRRRRRLAGGHRLAALAGRRRRRCLRPVLGGLRPDRAPPPGVALGLALAMVVQALVFGLLISRWCPAWWGFGSEPPPGVQRLRDLGYLLAAALASAVVSALVGPALVIFASDADWTVHRRPGCVRNSVGIVAIFPLSLLARNAARSDAPDRSPDAVRSLPRQHRRSSSRSSSSRVGAGWLVFWVNDDLPMPFLLLATSVWAGTRFSPWVADLHALVLATGVVVCTVLDRGPVRGHRRPGRPRCSSSRRTSPSSVVLTLALSVGRRESLALHQRLAASEDAATEQATMMRTILDTMADGVSVVDATGDVVLRNPAAGLLVGDVQRRRRRRARRRRLRPAHADGTSVTARRLPDGARAGRRGGRAASTCSSATPTLPTAGMLEVTARPIPDSDPPLVVVVFHDVTADRRERDELASFAGVVAHDLLNPLTVVEGWSETLLETARAGIVVPPEKQAEQLERIQRAAQRMQHLISDLLAYTTARDLRITPVRVDLLAMVRDIARARVEASRVSDEPAPVITVDPALPDVLAEPVLLRQVVDNLVGNAVKYVAPGVCPEIEVRGRAVDGDDAADGADRGRRQRHRHPGRTSTPGSSTPSTAPTATATAAPGSGSRS